MQNKKKNILSLSLIVALLAVIVGGTYAYFTAETEDVTNTFTVGNLKVELEEPNWPGKDNADYKGHLVPGVEIAKDPTVKVMEDSEDAYVFMYLKNNLYGLMTGDNSVIDLDMSGQWSRLTKNETGESLYVYVGEGEEKKPVKVKGGTKLDSLFNRVKVSETATQETLTGPFTDINDQTIVVQAYAHQASNNNETNSDLYEIALTAAKDKFGFKE